MTEDTPTNANDSQAEFWNGPMGEKWVRLETGLDEFFESALSELIRRSSPTPGERVLDIGCGGGASTLAAAKLVLPTGHVTGIDISRPLLNRAEARCKSAGVRNIDFLEVDAQVHPFESGAYDLAISRFGVMFFDDPVAAFRNIGRAMKSGGRIVFLAWAAIDDCNPWFAIPHDIAVARLGPPPAAAPHAPGPFAFAAIERVERMLRDAGFANVKGKRTQLKLSFGGGIDDAALLMLNVGPAGRLLIQYEAGPDVAEDIQREIRGRIGSFVVHETLHVPATLNVFTARCLPRS
jgi:SAM-dependent methyltransferase